MDSISVRTSIACCGADGEKSWDVQSQVIIPRRPRPYMPPSSQEQCRETVELGLGAD